MRDTLTCLESMARSRVHKRHTFELNCLCLLFRRFERRITSTISLRNERLHLNSRSDSFRRQRVLCGWRDLCRSGAITKSITRSQSSAHMLAWIHATDRLRTIRCACANRVIRHTLCAVIALHKSIRFRRLILCRTIVATMQTLVRARIARLFILLWSLRVARHRRIATQVLLRRCIKGLVRQCAVASGLRTKMRTLQVAVQARVRECTFPHLVHTQSRLVTIRSMQDSGRIRAALHRMTITVDSTQRLCRLAGIVVRRSNKRCLTVAVGAWYQATTVASNQTSILHAHNLRLFSTWRNWARLEAHKSIQSNCALKSYSNVLKTRYWKLLTNFATSRKTARDFVAPRLHNRGCMRRTWVLWTRTARPLLQYERGLYIRSLRYRSKQLVRTALTVLNDHARRKANKRAAGELQVHCLSHLGRMRHGAYMLNCLEQGVRMRRQGQRVHRLVEMRLVLQTIAQWLLITVQRIGARTARYSATKQWVLRHILRWSASQRKVRNHCLANFKLKFLTLWVQYMSDRIRGKWSHNKVSCAVGLRELRACWNEWTWVMVQWKRADAFHARSVVIALHCLRIWCHTASVLGNHKVTTARVKRGRSRRAFMRLRANVLEIEEDAVRVNAAMDIYRANCPMWAMNQLAGIFRTKDESERRVRTHTTTAQHLLMGKVWSAWRWQVQDKENRCIQEQVLDTVPVVRSEQHVGVFLDLSSSDVMTATPQADEHVLKAIYGKVGIIKSQLRLLQSTYLDVVFAFTHSSSRSYTYEPNKPGRVVTPSDCLQVRACISRPPYWYNVGLLWLSARTAREYDRRTYQGHYHERCNIDPKQVQMRPLPRQRSS